MRLYVDEYGTVWSSEPGSSVVAGDLILPESEDNGDAYIELLPGWTIRRDENNG